MGVAKRTRKFGQVKRVISARDSRRRENATKADEANKSSKAKGASSSTEVVRQVPQLPSSLFFQHNEALVPPYNVLVDTNFLSHTVQRKLPLLESMMDLLYAKCDPVMLSLLPTSLPPRPVLLFSLKIGRPLG